MAHTLNINGEMKSVDAPDDLALLWVLRDKLGINGPKYGCGVDVCKSCTCLVDGKKKTVCSMSVKSAVGKEIITIEGLAKTAKGAAQAGTAANPLHVVQQVWIELDVAQCGFCQPGMILSAKALLARNACPTRAEIRHALSGNLCRCTGYTQILEAVELAVAESLCVEPAPRAWEEQRMDPKEAEERARRAAHALEHQRSRGGCC